MFVFVHNQLVGHNDMERCCRHGVSVQQDTGPGTWDLPAPLSVRKYGHTFLLVLGHSTVQGHSRPLSLSAPVSHTYIR